MKLVELSEADKIQYNNFVATAESGSFLQSWEWGQWQEKLGRKVARFFALDDGGQTIASAQTVIMPLAFGKFYVYVPYGPVFGAKFEIRNSKFDLSAEALAKVETIIKDIISKFSNAIFVRIEPKFGHLDFGSWNLPLQKTANIQPGKTLLINLTKPEDQLLAGMHPKTRYNIKLAQKHGVEIQDEFGLTIGRGLFAREALELIYQTSKRQGYLAQGPGYFAKLVDFFAMHNSHADLKLRVYKAIYQQQLLASAIMIDYAKTRTYLFGGSSQDHKNTMAPYLLHWKAMLDAKSAGFEYYDFWGIETSAGDTPGFVRFKLGFGGSATQYPGAYDVVQDRLQYKLYKAMRLLNKWQKKIHR